MVYMKGKKIGQAIMMCICEKICSGGKSKNISNMCGKGRKYCRGIKWMKKMKIEIFEVIEVEWV